MPITRLNNNSITSVTTLPSGITSLPSSITSASGLALGKVLQVVQTVDKNQGSFALATDTLSTMMTLNITPTSSSSKILVRFDAYFGNQSTPARPYAILRRDGSDIYRSNTAGSRKNSTGSGNTRSQDETACVSNEFLDSPATTSQVTYTIVVGGYDSRTFYKNIPDANGDYVATSCSQIIAMEIAN